MRKISKFISLLGIAVALITTACTHNQNNTESIVNDITYLMNLRYTGLQEDDKGKIRQIIPQQADTIISRLDVGSEPIFIDLEDDLRHIESSLSEEEKHLESSKLLVTENGRRGIYSDKVYLREDGTFLVTMYGQPVYIKAPESVYIQQLKGNGVYKLKMVSYHLYEDGNLYITYSSDLKGAFEEKYRNKEDKELYYSDYMLNQQEIKDYTIIVKLSNGVIHSVDTDNIIGLLEP